MGSFWFLHGSMTKMAKYSSCTNARITNGSIKLRPRFLIRARVQRTRGERRQRSRGASSRRYEHLCLYRRDTLLLKWLRPTDHIGRRSKWNIYCSPRRQASVAGNQSNVPVSKRRKSRQLSWDEYNQAARNWVPHNGTVQRLEHLRSLKIMSDEEDLKAIRKETRLIANLF